MEEPEYLTATRARRANAGSRLKQLVEMEASSESQASQFVTEDDENVNLLFQEDENDDEFAASGSESEGGSGGSDNDGDGDDAGDGDQTEQPNVDEQLSDSDISASDMDESEGEKELEKEERSKKRRLKQKNKLIPAIKKFKTAEEKAKKAKPKVLITSDSLVSASRRSSARKSAISNKEALVQRLKEDEERRSKLAPVIRPKERDLTQEERFAQAVETEKANIISLELFREQEVVKKERQKQLLMSRRVKMKNIVRFVSQEMFITPGDIIDQQREIYYAIHNKGRRKNIRKIRRLINFDITKFPGSVDTQLPLVRAEIAKQEAEKARQEAEKAKAELANGGQNGAAVPGEQPNGSENGAVAEPAAQPAAQTATQPAATNDAAAEVKSEPIDGPNGEEAEKEKKKVTFAPDVKPHEETPADAQQIPEAETEDTEEPKEKEIFQGPVQKLIKNAIYLVDFDKNYNLTDLDFLREAVFGKEATLPGTRRFKDLKPILRIGGAHNPYAKVKEEKDELLMPVSDLTEEDSMFEELNRLPKLGIRQEIIEEVEEIDENDGAIVIKTEAPTGLYLPNGNKKFCLITTNEVKYFDTGNGVPYFDVDTFKFLKGMEEGNIPWYTFDTEFNDTGPTEIYLGSRDGSVRHARGVPEGFDA